MPELNSAANMHEMVEYLVNSVRSGKTQNFESFFAIVENLIIFSEPEDRKRLIVDLLEDLKNYSSLCDLDYIIFEDWLGPETHLAWRWLEKKWQGKKSLADHASGIG